MAPTPGRSATRTLLLALALAAALPGIPLEAGTAPRPRKSAQDCNDELRDKATAITAAGMSASAFFHSCWWNSEPGTPTPIVADERAKRPFEARSSGVRPAARQPAGAPRRATRIAGRRRPSLGRDEESAPLPIDEPAAVPEAVEARSPPYPEPSALPGRVSVGVPAIGQLSLPILPVLAPVVKAVAGHAPVPGLVTTTP